MYSSPAAPSPFRTGGQSLFGPPQQAAAGSSQSAGAFGQQTFGPSSSTSHSQQAQGQSSYFGTPQYGSSSWNGAAASPGMGAYGGATAASGGAFGASASTYGMAGQAYGGHPGTPGAPGQPGMTGTPGGYGDKAKRSYLPGYLSSGAMAQVETSALQSMDDSRTWESPARRTSISGSPATRFGGQSLFGSKDSNTPSKSPKMAASFGRDRVGAGVGSFYRSREVDEDAPPISSLGDTDDSLGSFNSETPASQSTQQTAAAPSSSRAPRAGGYAVYVFGFPSSALELVLEYFGQFGDIVSSTPSSEGGNWVTIAYAQPWSAFRAARKNGEVLGGALMIGVKAVDEDQLKRAMTASENGESMSKLEVSTPAQPRTPLPATTPAGKSVNVLGPDSAFKPTPPRRGFFSSGGGVQQSSSGNTKSADPHASLFAEKSRQALLQQQEQQQRGVLGRVSDAIFGW